MTCLTVGHRLVGPVDKQIVLGDVCKFYEIRTQGSEGKGMGFDLTVTKGSLT